MVKRYEQIDAKEKIGDISIVMAKLHKVYPWMNQSFVYHHDLDERRALLRLKEGLWSSRMSSTRGNTLRWYIRTGLTALLAVNIWVLYKRVEFYMEHSFDLLNPDIDYIIERY